MRLASLLFTVPAVLSLTVACTTTDAGSTSDAAPPEGGTGVGDSGADGAREAASDGSPLDGAACTLVRPYSTKTPACNDCAEAHCCAPVNACLLDLDCDDGYVNCALACALDFDAGGGDAGPVTCLAQCAAQYPKGRTEYDAATGCVDAACTACR